MGDERADLFEKETTVSQSPAHIIRLMILQQLDLTEISWRKLLIASKGGDAILKKKVFVAHAKSLIGKLRPTWLRSDKNNKNNKNGVDLPFDKAGNVLGSLKYVDLAIEDGRVDDVMSCLFIFLDRIELTKFDNKQKFDSTNVVTSNKFHKYV